MGTLNLANRTLAVMDNYPFLRSLNNECIDLIAIDPPFAANETFTSRPKPPISQAEFDEEVALAKVHGAAHNEGIGETRVKDYWNWDDDIHPEWKMRIQDNYPSVHAVIEAVEACATENEAAYICFMAVRLIECRRVLKPTGSIYVHCNDDANSYLRMLLDAVFGTANFRNAIVWKRTARGFKGSQFTPRSYNSNTDTILFYAKTSESFFDMDRVLEPYELGYLEKAFKLKDDKGSYYMDVAFNRPSASPRPNLCYEYKGFFPPHPSGWKVGKPRMEELDTDGELVIQGNQLYRKIRPKAGSIRNTLWDDINEAKGKERTGYVTQKPLELYERIIKASSNPGDVVLDIFAGCATTAVAAERLERKWIACDMAYRSWTMLKRRFYLNGIALDGMTDSTRNALSAVKKDKGFQEPQQWTSGHVIGAKELPKRADTDPAAAHELSTRQRGRRSQTQTANWSGQISKDDAKELLINRFGPVCWGCGYEPRRPNNSLDLTLLEVDHIRARKAAEGVEGDDELYNLALLHRTCNSIKRNRLTLEELRRHNADNGLLYVNTIGELVDLSEATRYAAQEISRHAVRHGL